MPLETYLPKKEALTTKFSVSLTPSESSRPSHPSAAISYPHKDRKADGIKFKEKRLDARIWRCKGGQSERYPFPDLLLHEQCRPPIASEVGGAQAKTTTEIMARFAVADDQGARLQVATARENAAVVARTSAIAGETAAVASTGTARSRGRTTRRMCSVESTQRRI